MINVKDIEDISPIFFFIFKLRAGIGKILSQMATVTSGILYIQ